MLWRRTQARNVFLLALVGVVVEALTSLAAQPTSIDVLLEEGCWAVLGVTASAGVEDLHDSEASVKTNEVSKSQGTHGYTSAQLHGGVNVLTSGDTLLQDVNGLVDVRHKNAIRNEAGEVLGLGSDLAHLSSEIESGIKSLLARGETGDDLDELHNWNRVHEVHTDDLLGAIGRSSNLRDGDRRGVRSEDRLLGSDLVELGEDLLLKLDVLTCRLNDEISDIESIKRGTHSHAGESSVHIILTNLALLHILLQKLRSEVFELIELGLLAINNDDVELGVVGSDEGNAGTHLARTYDAHGLDLACCRRRERTQGERGQGVVASDQGLSNLLHYNAQSKI